MPDKLTRDVDFLYELNDLRLIKRRYPFALQTASVSEHVLRVCFIALILARKAGADPLKTLQIAMLHDLPEVRTGDAHPWQKPYVEMDSLRALGDMLAGTGLEDLGGLIEDYEARESLEAQLVKDADMIDTELEMKELAMNGAVAYDRLAAERSEIKNRLRTEVGKALYLAVEARDPFNRYLEAESSFSKGKKVGS